MVDAFKVVSVEINNLPLTIPIVLRDLFDFINNEMIEGLFRINGSLKKINYYYSNLHKYKKWLPDANIYDICSLLKKILITNYKFIDVERLDLTQLKGLTSEDFNWEYFNKFINNNINYLNLNIFIYSINFISNLLNHTTVTKMSLLNYSIIFQPIFLTCDDLIYLPNYINLLNFLLGSVDLVVLDYSLIDENYKLDVSASEFHNETPNDKPFKFMFKNFKNKSIDSMNDIGKKFPFGNDFGFKGYKMSNRSAELLAKTVEEDKILIKNDLRLIEDDEISNDQESKVNTADSVEKFVTQLHKSVSGTVFNSTPTSIEDITFTSEEPLQPPPSNSSVVEKYDSAKESISSQSSGSPGLDTSFAESFQSLDPESRPRKYQVYNQNSIIDESVDPLTVDPEVNELVQLEDINTKSFQFNINLPTSPHSSFHSTTSHHLNEFTRSNTSQDTNDTSFNSTNSKSEDTITPEYTLDSSPKSIKSKRESIFGRIEEAVSIPRTRSILESPEKTARRNSILESPERNNRRNSRILSRIESRLSTTSDRTSIIEKRKSFIRLFKNESGVKLSLKLKSKSVY